MVGLGQGGLVVAALRWPLVVELTLQARNLQRKEARSAGEAWAGLKAVWSIRPKLWKTQSGHSEIAEACPELARDFPEPPVRGFGIVGKSPRLKKFLRPFAWMLLGASRTPASGACSTSRPESCGPSQSTLTSCQQVPSDAICARDPVRNHRDANGLACPESHISFQQTIPLFTLAAQFFAESPPAKDPSSELRTRRYAGLAASLARTARRSRSSTEGSA